VVGSVNADLVVKVDRRPGAGETVLGSDLATYPGGKGANQAVAAARLGAKVSFLGRVGSDAHGEFLRSALNGDGVGTDALLPTPGASGVALITVDPDGDNSIIVSAGANGRLTAEDVRAAQPLLAAAAIVSLQLEIPLPAVIEAALLAAAAGARVMLNLSPAADIPDDLLALCDPLVVNEHEARSLLKRDTDNPAAALLELGARSVVVTLGADGVVVAGDGELTAISSPKVTAVDTTGAGDAFTGALAWRLAAGDRLADAARVAVKVGAAAVRKPGAQSSFPRLDELQ
jgi:ribokinase